MEIPENGDVWEGRMQISWTETYPRLALMRTSGFPDLTACKKLKKSYRRWKCGNHQSVQSLIKIIKHIEKQNQQKANQQQKQFQEAGYRLLRR